MAATQAREQTSVRISRETKLEIERLAEADRRSVSEELLFDAAVKARGQQRRGTLMADPAPAVPVTPPALAPGSLTGVTYALSSPHYNADHDRNHHNRYRHSRACAEAVVPLANNAVEVAHRRPSLRPTRHSTKTIADFDVCSY
jgi:hypothetical protein